MHTTPPFNRCLPLRRRALGARHAVLLALTLGSTACGRDAADAGARTPGVGLDPDEIGPLPTESGGLVEYNYVDFGGAGLPLGLLGLVSYDAVGPEGSDIKPPYGVVTAIAFILDTNAASPDVAFSSYAIAPAIEGSCYTSYRPGSGGLSVADAGDHVTIEGTDGSFRYDIGRRPVLYPKNNIENAFPYYFDLGPYRSEPLYYYDRVESGTFTELEAKVAQVPNFAHGAEAEFSFPGTVTPAEASFSSIPVPSSAEGADLTFMTPSQPSGVMLSWKGPVYDASGNEIDNTSGSETGTNTCFQFIAHETAPAVAEDCLTYQEPVDEFDNVGDLIPFEGQMYTAPWETDDGLTFSWVPPEAGTAGEDDYVLISVRLLGPVDEDDKYKQVGTVEVIEDGDVYGTYEKLACEQEGEDYEWEFDPALLDSDGDYIPSLQGEPSDTLAEVTCWVPDNGSFTVTEDLLADALAFGERNEAQGAIFYMSRAQYGDLDTPPARDAFGNLRDVEPLRVVSNSVVLGRFWYGK